MSRYIDADALHDALKAKQKWVVRCGDKHNEGYTYDQVHFTIDDAPSIDIVRCKECKYCKTYYHSYDNIPSRCLRTLNDVNADDFCSYGQKERTSVTYEEARLFLDNLKTCIHEHPVVADWLVEIANRKDEPTGSEKPNNSTTEDCSDVGKE